MIRSPLISIIINNYNYGRFLSDAINSALRQTYRPIEVIVVDDGSTDQSREVIVGYEGQIRAVFKENGGQASAMNAGFTHASGEIVLFLDSDDTLFPDVVEHVVGAWRRQPELARVHYRMEVIDAQGRPNGVVKPHAHLPMLSGDLGCHVLTFPDDMAWLPTSGNAYNAQVLQRIFPIPEQPFRILADVYLSHVTPLFGPVVALDQVGAHYRVHGGNNYESTEIDLERIRSIIVHWRAAHEVLRHFASRLNLSAERLGSVAYAANRMISLRLDPKCHPISEDRRWRVFHEGVAAARRRFDVAWPMKALFIMWFAMMSVAPRPLARVLAERWLFPQKRGNINTLLGRLHLAKGSP